MGVLLEIGINLFQILEQDKNSAPATLDLISNVQSVQECSDSPKKPVQSYVQARLASLSSVVYVSIL